MASFSIKVAKKKHTFEVDQLDPQAVAGLIDEVGEMADGPVVLGASDLAEWPAESQDAFWQLWKALSPQRSVKLRVDGVLHAQPLDAVLAGLVNGTDPQRYEQALNAAARAIRCCYSAAAHVPCVDRVFKRLRDLGVAGLRRPDLLRLVQRTAPATAAAAAGKDRPNPTLLAADFLKRFRKRLGAAGAKKSDCRGLHFHNGTFYSWDRCWRAVGLEEMRATVVKDLQDHSGVDAVTAGLAQNVLLNLQGLCLVGRGDEPLPFFIDDYGPPTKVRRRQFLTLQNGMLNLKLLAAGADPKLLDFDPRWFGTSLLPFDYDPKAKCPRFKKFLYQVLECDPDTGNPLHAGDRRLSVLQEWFGYTLLSDGRFQKFLLMVGEGNNGKGVIQNLWVKMLGLDNVSHVSLDQLSGRFALQPLLGKLANICGDLNEIDSVSEGILKRLTGQDNVTVDRKNLPLITLAPSVKLIFATNALPRFKDKSRGVWRRLIVMPFRVSIPEGQENETLAQELEAEVGGILNWALRGLCRLLENQRFSPCSVCAAARSEHQFDCDPVAQFLDESGLYPPPEPPVPRKVTAAALYKQYADWCREVNRCPLSSNEFNRRIAKLPGVQKGRQADADPEGRRPYFWTGIGKPVPLPPPADADDEGDGDAGEPEE
jgi:putative DNA primase/helicase